MLRGKSLEEKLEALPEVSDVGRYKNVENYTDYPWFKYPERARFHLLQPQYDYFDIEKIIDRLETQYPILQAGGVEEIILYWTIVSNDPAHEVNTELDREHLLRLVNLNGSLAITFYAKAHL